MKNNAPKTRKKANRTNGKAPKVDQPIAQTQRLAVLKTYKLFIGGKYPRTESGRYYTLTAADGTHLAHVCRASRKDFRDAVVAARKAFPAWAARSAYNRGQILYRMAEIMEGRKAQFVDELVQLGMAPQAAQQDVTLALDRLLYYAGWTDKYVQVFSSVNPVASSHFNFSVPEPMGVVALLCPQQPGLLPLVSTLMPIITGGNSCVLLAARQAPTLAISFAEALAVSDLPGGVVNILTGFEDELAFHFASHKDVNALVYAGEDEQERLRQLQELATHNLKRVLHHHHHDWTSGAAQSPYWILDTQEIKTTWHPVGK